MSILKSRRQEIWPVLPGAQRAELQLRVAPGSSGGRGGWSL